MHTAENKASFWEFLDRLVTEHSIVIDRPRGTAHPVHSAMIYPMDYGYLEGTVAGDGAQIDVWLGSQPGKRLDALMLTADLEKRDAEIKLLVNCTPEEVQVAAAFLSSEHMQVQIVERDWQPLQWLATRRSVRQFLNKPVPAEILDRILDAACSAPSAHNRQPWRFVVIRSHHARETLATAMGAEFQKDLIHDGISTEDARRKAELSRLRLVNAPVVVLLCLDREALDVYPDSKRQAASLTMMVQSVAMAGQNLLLAAHASGLGAVWVCAPLFAAQSASKALQLPEGWIPQGLVYLGYPKDWPARRPKQNLRDVTVYIE